MSIGASREGRVYLDQIEDAEAVCSLDHSLDLRQGPGRRDIEQGSGECGGRQALFHGAVLLVERGCVVDSNSGSAMTASGNADLDNGGVFADEAPQPAG